MRDFDVAALRAAFTAFDVDPDVDLVAVAAFDHGAAPPGSATAASASTTSSASSVPIRARWPSPTRRRSAARPHAAPAVAADAAATYGQRRAPANPDAVFVMDTGAAAVAGALEDPAVRAQ